MARIAELEHAMEESVKREAKNIELKTEVMKLRNDVEELKRKTPQTITNAPYTKDNLQSQVCSILPETSQINIISTLDEDNSGDLVSNSTEAPTSRDQESVQKTPCSSGNPTIGVQSTIFHEIISQDTASTLTHNQKTIQSESLYEEAKLQVDALSTPQPKKTLPEKQNNSAHYCAYFHNKILG
ncbi:9674_t:CDS:2 [Dentiscutata erythropus]|uniref:9674_t:CDS:1 n=1 Tax=Dentiscutata erythropus TaxID=1348616 RepID=A0A9N9NX48_9GLOM|nr:9674_t:CDS:2 [Dentiscutata erythropus]